MGARNRRGKALQEQKEGKSLPVIAQIEHHGQLTAHEEVEEELAKLFRSMHLMSERDIDATMTRVFQAMMRMGREGPVGSTDLSRASGLNRITVIHHLKRLENAGVVEKHESKYVMRVRSIEEMMDGMRIDMLKQFEEMDRMARDLDRAFLDDFERYHCLRGAGRGGNKEIEGKRARGKGTRGR
jgi:predicted transcriptional regulator